LLGLTLTFEALKEAHQRINESGFAFGIVSPIAKVIEYFSLGTLAEVAFCAASVSPLCSRLFATMFHAVVAVKTYIVTFRRQKDRRPSKFIVVADSMREAIDMAWEHGGADFQAMFDKATGQAEEMKRGILRVL
jgi:hypothetical protein